MQAGQLIVPSTGSNLRTRKISVVLDPERSAFAGYMRCNGLERAALPYERERIADDRLIFGADFYHHDVDAIDRFEPRRWTDLLQGRVRLTLALSTIGGCNCGI
jgi:hypothetical protein